MRDKANRMDLLLLKQNGLAFSLSPKSKEWLILVLKLVLDSAVLVARHRVAGKHNTVYLGIVQGLDSVSVVIIC